MSSDEEQGSNEHSRLGLSKFFKKKSFLEDDVHSGEESKNKTEKKFSSLLELLKITGIALVIMFVVNNFLLHTYIIPSESMMDTLQGCSNCKNDRIIIDKITYRFRDPSPGDVVVFKAPNRDWEEASFSSNRSSHPIVKGVQETASWFGLQPPDEFDLVKRIIAVGGQTISCRIADGGITVDHKPIQEPYLSQQSQQVRQRVGPCWGIPVYYTQAEIDAAKKNSPHCLLDGVSAGDNNGEFGPIKIPEGSAFVMGDNRSNSKDSRFHILDGNCGAVPYSDIRGIARWIIYPFNRIGSIASINPQN